MKKSHKYKLKYSLDANPGEFDKDEITDGGTDALIVGSLLFPEDGSYSQTYFSIDGRNKGKAVPVMDEFKFWLLMAKSLSENEKLPEGRRAFCRMAFDTFVEAMKHVERTESGSIN